VEEISFIIYQNYICRYYIIFENWLLVVILSITMKITCNLNNHFINVL